MKRVAVRVPGRVCLLGEHNDWAGGASVVVPMDRGDVVERSLQRLSAARVDTFLAVLKTFGPANGGHLSFPGAGWTLAFDVRTLGSL